MYRDNLEALQARVGSLEAELEAERKRREATQAELNAARAQLYEHQVHQRQRNSAQCSHSRGMVSPAWPLAMVLAVSAVSALYLGMQHARCQNAHRKAFHRASMQQHLLERPAVVAIPELKKRAWNKCPFAQKQSIVRDFDAKRTTRFVSIHYRHDIQRCLIRSSDKNSKTDMMLRLLIAKDGHVLRANLHGQADSSVKSCLEKRAKRWIFPRSKSTVLFRLPLQLR
jgi:hypothetical protein